MIRGMDTHTEVPTLRWPLPGEPVRFQNGDDVLTGVCNGPARGYDDARPELITHVPVYVRDGDRCLMVHASNIVEWAGRNE